MILFPSKEYPNGRYWIQPLEGAFHKRFILGKGIGFWKHPRIPIGCFADWSLRLAFIEIKKLLSEKQMNEF